MWKWTKIFLAMAIFVAILGFGKWGGPLSGIFQILVLVYGVAALIAFICHLWGRRKQAKSAQTS